MFRGWRFVAQDEENKPPRTDPEPLFGFQLMRELYLKANPEYIGKFSVPILWDTKTNTIVNNESAELIAMLNNEFNAVAKYPDIDLYPKAERSTIDAVANSFLYGLNSGVYRCGQATTQKDYNEAFEDVFKTMDMVEERLAHSQYICGDRLTLADVRLFPTLIRFDAAYVNYFKTNLRMLKDYKNICDYTRELYQMPAIHSTVNFEHIKGFYFSNTRLNPLGIIPIGPDLSYLDEAHGRVYGQ
jgi:glutathionyl-hydroquinone reductase